MKLYSLEVPVWATVYVKAETRVEAARLARFARGHGMELAGNDRIDSRPFAEIMADPNALKWTLSPCMTIGYVKVLPDEMEEVEL